uniref:Uncharacterized protein n=1 Tax=Ranid herpesvirus 4 TaxID=2849006 RepID=A0A8F3CIG0_9VIRU|nr:MAG: hypothetical protein [Ranid herpesvirus 4]
MKLLREILHAAVQTRIASFNYEDKTMVLTFDDDLDIPTSLQTNHGKSCLASLQNIRVPVPDSARGTEALVRQYTVLKQTSKRCEFKLIFSGEAVLGLIFLFWENTFYEFYDKISENIVSCTTPLLEVDIPPLSPIEHFLLSTMGLSPKLETTYLQGSGKAYFGRRTGLRLYALQKELKTRADLAMDIDGRYHDRALVNRFGSESEYEEDILFECPNAIQNGAICASLTTAKFKLVRFTVHDYAQYVFAKEFCTFTSGLNLFDGPNLTLSNKKCNKCMPGVVLPKTQVLSKLHDTMTLAINPTTRKATLIMGWEYIIAARINYLFKYGTEPNNPKLLTDMADSLKRKYKYTYSIFAQTGRWQARKQKPEEQYIQKYYGKEELSKTKHVAKENKRHMDAKAGPSTKGVNSKVRKILSDIN